MLKYKMQITIINILFKLSLLIINKFTREYISNWRFTNK